MPKTIYGQNYELGGNIHEIDAPKGVKVVPDNKTLVIMPFNDDHDIEVDPVRLKSMTEIFEHYQPEREVDLENIDGEAEEMTLKFGSVRDFSRDSIIERVPLLSRLESDEGSYAKLTDIFKNNEKLKSVLSKEETKKEFVELLELLIEELE